MKRTEGRAIGKSALLAKRGAGVSGAFAGALGMDADLVAFDDEIRVRHVFARVRR